jgi:hypothetical protein
MIPGERSRRLFDKAIDFLWGDRPPLTQALRFVLKLLTVLVVALVIHEGLTWWSLSPGWINSKPLLESFKNANTYLEKITPAADLNVARLSICLDAKPVIDGGCKETQFTSDENYAIGYRVVDAKNPLRTFAQGTIYHVKPVIPLVSVAHIRESIDTLLRKIELVAFNGTDKPITEVKLCNGTRTLELSANCNTTKQIGEALGTASAGIFAKSSVAKSEDNLQGLIDSVRFSSLFIGPIQFGTFFVFLYAVLETLGLWLRWVAPRDRLFDTVVNEGKPEKPAEADEATAGGTVNGNSKAGYQSILRPRPLPGALDEALSSPRRSAGDRLYLVDLKAAGNVPNSPPATPEEFISIHSSYRDYLQEEAISRQDFLETLGDTMLKLAFLGTVYGISAALFAARGLDTADPILRLATKADMYSGIGVGFGTTLLGILLSIIAAQLRTVLASTWSGRIGVAYQLILDFGVERLRGEAGQLPPSKIEGIGTELPADEPTRGTIEVFGGIVLLALGLTAVIVFRKQLMTVFQSIVG